MNVLVTGFTPFNKSTNNYSTEVLNYLTDVEKVIIDVVYDKCYLDLVSKYNLDDFDLIIAMGEARMRDELTLEIQAKNISSCSLADNSGVVKQNDVIDSNFDNVIRTNVDVGKVSELIKFSYDAGKFVCNNLYFHLLANYPNKSLFIHIPNCNNDEGEYIKHAKTINKIIDILIEKRI